MYSAHVNATSKYEMDFKKKVKYNFKLHVVLCSKGANWARKFILKEIFLLNGYRCHKIIKHGMHWSHLHVKFTEEHYAKAAVDYFTKLNSDFTAVLVDDLLRDWYNLEMRSGYNPHWTLAIVDIIGTTPNSLNFLTSNLLDYIFQDFGKPFLIPYTAAVTETHVQVLFYSMTQALAACWALGQWYTQKVKSDVFSYRVRINPSHKEALLIKNSGGNPEDAFKLDYFVNMKHRDSQISTIGREVVHQNTFHNPGFESQPPSEPNFIPEQHFYENVPQMRPQYPYLIVPIITAPPRVSAPQVFAEPDQTYMFVDIQNACVEVEQTRALTEKAVPEVQISSSNVYESSVDSRCRFQSTVQHSVYEMGKNASNNYARISKCFQSTESRELTRQSNRKQKKINKNNR